MLNSRFVASIVVVGGIALSGAAQADVRVSKPAGRDFGLGLMVGAPTGLSGKYYGDRVALAFGLGEYWHHGHYDGDDYDDDLAVFMDVHFHPAELVRNATLSVPLYIGVGGRVSFYDHVDHDHTSMGVRVPLGIAMNFRRTPMDVFFELAFDLDLVGDDHHDHGSHLGGALGARYYF